MASQNQNQGLDLARKIQQRWASNPVLCARELLRQELWSRQQDVARGVFEHPQVAVRSGHKTGKSHVAACLAIWWALTRPNARCVLTAPTWHQIANVLWKEIRRLIRGATVSLPAPFIDAHRGWRLANDSEIIALSVDKAENLAGPSGADQLVIVDEASGYDEAFWPVLQSMVAGGGRLLAIGNPTRLSGQFYDAFTRQRDLWHTLAISSLETPNVVTGKRVIPGLATRGWVDARRAEYGEESPIWFVRVLGEFPSQGENAVIPLEFVDRALQRWNDTQEEPRGAWTFGVDVARFGDDSSVCQPMCGDRAPLPVVVRGCDSIQVAAMVRDQLTGPDAVRRQHEPATVNVDMGGNFGAGVVDTLNAWNREHRLGEHVAIVGVNPSCRADDPDRFPLLRDQLWWDLRDWLKERGAIAPNPTLEAELVAPIYSPDSKARLKIEAKEQTKKRLSPRRSPDRADALALAVHHSEPVNMQQFDRPAPVLCDAWGATISGSRWDGMGGKGF